MRNARGPAALAALALLIGITGCGTARQPDPPSDTTSTTIPATDRPAPPTGYRPIRDGADPVSTAPPERLTRLFMRARSLVENDSGVDLSAVRMRLVDDAAILEEVTAETRRLVRGRLGEGALSERLLHSLVAGLEGSYAALYSPRRLSILISREVLSDYLASVPAERGRREAALLALLLHELVHAADDSRYAIHDNRTLDFRASFAQSAAFEGHAQWRTRALCRQHDCLDGLASLDAFMFGQTVPPLPVGAESGQPASGHPASGQPASGPLTPRGSDAERNLLEYAYVEGERFVAALASRPDGSAAIEHLLSSPPADPLQILDPASFPNTAREARNRRLLAASLRVDHPWLGDDGSRIAVETSPLKGVNLREDPARREAAIDGFTRLITAMVAVQFHDPRADTISPIEVTLMQTNEADTARVFADTLHAHARLQGVRTDRQTSGRRAMSAEPGHGDTAMTAPHHRLARTVMPLPDGGVWRTAIATDGVYVVQASGRASEAAPMEAYVLGALDTLLSTN